MYTTHFCLRKKLCLKKMQIYDMHSSIALRVADYDKLKLILLAP